MLAVAVTVAVVVVAVVVTVVIVVAMRLMWTVRKSSRAVSLTTEQQPLTFDLNYYKGVGRGPSSLTLRNLHPKSPHHLKISRPHCLKDIFQLILLLILPLILLLFL